MKNEPTTKISGKNKSPLIIRRINTTQLGVMFVSIISDDNLNSLDTIIHSFLEDKKPPTMIQDARNLVGNLSDELLNNYKRTEGVAIIAYFDKLLVSSLYGDFMSHLQCRLELFSLLNLLTGV